MPHRKRKKDKPAIEYQETVAETGRRSYELLRLSRVKYAENPRVFIDLRLFNRGYDDSSGEETYFPTQKGVQLEEERFQRLIGKWTLVPSLLFHRTILEKSFDALKRDEFDTAVFRSFKAVEIRVRELGSFPHEVVGVELMRRAFNVDNGPLSDISTPKSEREALSHLFSGAIGCYKNPHSHRDVKLTFKEAFEMILVASHLLQLLDRIEKRLMEEILE